MQEALQPETRGQERVNNVNVIATDHLRNMVNRPWPKERTEQLCVILLLA